MSTPYHAKYFAHEITRFGGEGVERLGRSLFDASVDLNPHQIEAALFALRSPISKGILLADEVGLGKTIEAGIMLCQYWAERKRHLLVISPASLRKQWEQEIEEKFHLPAKVLDSRKYRKARDNGDLNPFDAEELIICSMNYASRMAEELRTVSWDLVVIDEAHKLRNAYRPSNRIGRNIRWAVGDNSRTILLTATPLQNSLLELYGLSTIIDDQMFGDLRSFRSQYVNTEGNLDELRERLQAFCKRTLRCQVNEYIQYTERKLITQPFCPTEDEQNLYEGISDYLQRDDNYALPSGQRHLIVLLVRKVLASSSQAVAGTLEIMRKRLLRIREDAEAQQNALEQFLAGEDLDEDLIDTLLTDEEDLVSGASLSVPHHDENTEDIDLERLDSEIEELKNYIQWAQNIGIDTKSKALLTALKVGFDRMEQMGAESKAVIFTESRRTQTFLKDFLDNNGYEGRVLTFNGTNRESYNTDIYNKWLQDNKDTGRTSGSRVIDVRTAIIETFREKAQILIATEAAAEGVNLQFCSLVINFDLPWNPQRIEQRIGRCHRYGQKYDVVVINFLNERNEADQRVYELLDSKFKLFDGVFGASDEVLGAFDSGVDFERRVLEIYQQCRTRHEIQDAFETLQLELDNQIQSRIKNTQRLLLEHFDEDVHERLRVNLSGARERLDRIGIMFWSLTRFVLADKADFNDQDYSFYLHHPPAPSFRKGRYHMISKQKGDVAGEFLYRLSHPLGEFVISQATALESPRAEIAFNITDHPSRISVIEQLKNKSGWLHLRHLCIDSFEREEYLLFSAIDDHGKNIDQETCEKLFNCAGTVRYSAGIDTTSLSRLLAESDRHTQATLSKSMERNYRHFNEARDQLDKWAEDMELAAQKQLDDIKRQIRDLQRKSRQAPTLAEQHKCQEQIARLEKRKRRQRQKIFDTEDEIAERREQLISALEKRMQQKSKVTDLFSIRWHVI